MTIIEVVHNWPAETFIQRHLDALHAKNIHVIVMARHTLKEYSDVASVGTVTSHSALEYPNFDHMTVLERILSLHYFGLKSQFWMERGRLRDRVALAFFQRLCPNLIHFHSADLAALMAWIPNALGIPYTLSLRGSDIQNHLLISASQRDSILSAIHGASKVHAVCQSLAASAMRLVGQDLNISVIYTTVPIPSHLGPWKAAPRNGPIKFVTTGRLVWRKGLNYLLLALRQLRDHGVDARLAVIGVGPDLEQLLYLRNTLGLETTVDFLGKLTYREILHVFSQSHGYVQSSVAEGLSNSLVEAMANGLPVFATDVGGTCEVIEDSVSGFLLQPFAPQDWLDKLTQVRDYARMEQVRGAAFEKAKLLFSFERHADGFKALFEDARNV